MSEPLIYDLSSPGRRAMVFPAPDVPEAELPQGLVRDELPLPEVSELQAVRHFVRLSQLNYSIDTGIYPLGSCTMKYNPKLNEDVARLPGFAFSHPLQPEATAQGNLALMHELQCWLGEIGGFAGISLQPAAGAHGELTGILMIKAYHRDRGDTARVKILIPDSAHGTNPATTAMSGLQVVQLPSDARGNVDLEALRQACDETVAGLMLTNPNTLGLFEEHVLEVVKTVHDCGGLVYGDGANMNALLGIVRPGDLGFDVLHFNLHKTFSTPHGGGGPGAGAVGASAALVDFLPAPLVARTVDEAGSPTYSLVAPAKSIGRVKAFQGHFGLLVRAMAYLKMYGQDVRQIADHAVLNANYLKSRLSGTYHAPFDRICMHEFVVEGQWADAPGIRAFDVAKRLMDYGFHPPTYYFPLIVHEALMIEPTETESRESLDAFAEALLKIAQEAHTEPDTLRSAPHTTPFGRLDEVQAAKELVLCCRPVLSKEKTVG